MNPLVSYIAMKTQNPTTQDSATIPTATPLPVPTAPFARAASSLAAGGVVSSTPPDPGTSAMGESVILIPRLPIMAVGADVFSTMSSSTSAVGALVKAAVLSSVVGTGVVTASSIPTPVGVMVGAVAPIDIVSASVVHET